MVKFAFYPLAKTNSVLDSNYVLLGIGYLFYIKLLSITSNLSVITIFIKTLKNKENSVRIQETLQQLLDKNSLTPSELKVSRVPLLPNFDQSVLSDSLITFPARSFMSLDNLFENASL